MRRILFTGSIVAAALVFAASAGAAAAPSPTYQVAGIEIGAPQNDVSPFAGAGTGSTGDRAFWRAGIAHAPLAGCANVGSSCAITGGTFTLTSSNGSRLAGSFTGGAVTLTSQADGCGQQVFTVNANISTPTVQEQFTGVLTHYRFAFRGTCTVLAASVQGLLTAVVGDGGGTL
jgi:hypothetical protein